ncbi:MAG: tetratricopeptide repeat protein [Candidatus Bathyarchaeota archaeon]|jgi:tetratricopeptide (TPR) repeat protein|nr:tetratricopeptide repeat protein [Candidatus Bathyarchaeota archaeon]
MSVKEDPIKLHKDANSLMESGKYKEAVELFEKVAQLYYKGQNFFGSAEMYYKAGECSSALKEPEKAVEFFTKSADISFAKGFERYGISALENAREAHKMLGNADKVAEITKKIDDFNKKQQQEDTGESSFSVFS